MIKVSVMYPNTPGARFDHAYYRDTHMPLLKKRMGDSCQSYTVDKGLAGGAPGTPATYVGMCHIFCDSVEAFQAGFQPDALDPFFTGKVAMKIDGNWVLMASPVMLPIWNSGWPPRQYLKNGCAIPGALPGRKRIS